MAKLEDLYNAIKNADKAGDFQASQKIANEILRQNEVLALRKAERKAAAVANLTFGNPYPTETKVGTPPPSLPFMGITPIPVKKIPKTKLTKKQWYTKYYTENLSAILEDDSAGIDLTKGLSELPKRRNVKEFDFSRAFEATSGGVYTPPREGLSDRAIFGFLPTTGTKMTYLTGKFGKENVKFYKTPAHELFLWRESKDDPWKMPEPLETIDVADFTSDMASEILPTILSTAGGIATARGGPLTMAIGAGVGQAIGRAGQEYLVEKTLLNEVDVSRIVKKASVEGVLTAAFDRGFTFGGDKFIKSFLGREGTDLFQQTFTDFQKINPDQKLADVPFLQQGGQKAQTALSVEEKFPNGPVAKNLDIKRTEAGEAYQDIANPSRSTTIENQNASRVTLDHITENLEKQRKQLTARLSQLADERKALKTVAEKEANTEAIKEANRVFSEQVKRYADDVLASRRISPAEAGKNVRESLANQFADVTVAKSRMFDEAYEGLSDVSAPVSRLEGVFARHSEELLNDVEVDALQILNANARKTSQGVLKKLDELDSVNGTIDFKSLNEIIQKIEEKTRRGNFVKGFDGNQYSALANDLRILRTEMLDTADPLSALRFNEANQYYRDTYLRYVGGDIGSMVKPRKGQSYYDAISSRQSPIEFKVETDINPNYTKGSGTRRINGYKVKAKDGVDYYIKPDPTNPDPSIRFIVSDSNDDVISVFRTKADAVDSLERIDSPDVGTFLPPFEVQDDVILQQILKTSGDTRDFLELSGNSMNTRNLLRDAWLQSKGLKAGEPINVDRIKNLSDSDMDMVRVLFPEGQEGSTQSGVAGWNAKVETFEELQKLIQGKDDAIVEISAQTFDRIMKAGSVQEQKALRKIAREEQLINQRLDNHSSTMVEMANKGQIPLPTNRIQMKTFIRGLMKANPKEQKKFISLFNNPVNKGSFIDLEGAVFHEMVRKTKVNGKLVDAASPRDNTLWDPFEMAKELESNIELVTALVGREGYDNLVTSNRVLMNLTRPTTDDAGKQMVPRVAITSRGFQGWIGNVASPVTDRFASMVFSMQSKFPASKTIIDYKTYDTYQNALMRTIFLSRRGYEMLNSETEDSPEMADFVFRQLKALNDEAMEAREKAFPSEEVPILQGQ